MAGSLRSTGPSRALLGAARRILGRHLDETAVRLVLAGAAVRREPLLARIPPGLNFGGRHLLRLAAFAIAVHDALVAEGIDPDRASALVADIVEETNRAPLDWLHRAAVVRHRDPLRRLRWESRVLCRFYYARPAWELEEVPVVDGYGLDVRRCAIAEYYRSLGLGGLCEETICAQDDRMASAYGGPAGIRFRRTGTLAGGSDRCDFRYVIAD
jgi:hypothetical protein